MMHRIRINKTPLILVILILLNVLLIKSIVLAYQEGGIAISPPQIELKINPGEKTSKEINITNLSNKVQTYGLKIAGFDIDDNGDPERYYFLAGINTQSLDWISLDKNSVIVQPGSYEKVNLNIQPYSYIKPGSYYAAIMVLADTDSEKGIKEFESTVICSQIIIEVKGNLDKKIGIEYFKYSKGSLFSEKIDIITRLENQGNAYLAPEVKIKIVDKITKKDKEIDLNINKNIIFPGKTKTYSYEYLPKYRFGIYKAKIEVTYSDNVVIESNEISFWIMPWYGLIIIISIIIIGAIIVYKIRSRRYMYKWVKKLGSKESEEFSTE